jgi:hypothetical protein
MKIPSRLPNVAEFINESAKLPNQEEAEQLILNAPQDKFDALAKRFKKDKLAGSKLFSGFREHGYHSPMTTGSWGMSKEQIAWILSLKDQLE